MGVNTVRTLFKESPLYRIAIELSAAGGGGAA